MPAEKATGEVNRAASGNTRSNEEAASPPSAMPARTTASINANAVEWPLTNSKRKRNQTTSRESRQNPETKAATSHGITAVFCGAAEASWGVGASEGEWRDKAGASSTSAAEPVRR